MGPRGATPQASTSPSLGGLVGDGPSYRNSGGTWLVRFAIGQVPDLAAGGPISKNWTFGLKRVGPKAFFGDPAFWPTPERRNLPQKAVGTLSHLLREGAIPDSNMYESETSTGRPTATWARSIAVSKADPKDLRRQFVDRDGRDRSPSQVLLLHKGFAGPGL